MGATDSERFDVFFRGECLEGVDEAAVRAALGRLFRADEQTLEKLFSGELQRIKRSVDRSTAEKYRKAMEAAGARALIHAGGDAAPAASSAAQEPAPADSGDAAASFELTPVGSDMLLPEERPKHDAPIPATDHLDLAAVGENLGIEAEPAPSMPTPDFDVAGVGADLADTTRQATPAPPDTSGISLAAAEHDLSDCAPHGSDTPPPPVDHLAMAAPGGTLIDEDEREKPVPVDPPTDHLSLAEEPEHNAAGQGSARNTVDHP